MQFIRCFQLFALYEPQKKYEKDTTIITAEITENIVDYMIILNAQKHSYQV